MIFLKITIEDPPAGEEEQLIIRCRHLSGELLHLINTLKTQQSELIAYQDSNIYRLPPASVYYFEAMDNKVFLYAREQVYESRQKLYELETLLENGDFLRISKSVILNISKITSLSPAFSGRFEAMLDNGEKQIISRKYVQNLKKRLHI